MALFDLMTICPIERIKMSENTKINFQVIEINLLSGKNEGNKFFKARIIPKDICIRPDNANKI